jgi:4'-phosphopantetheinyl transferase
MRKELLLTQRSLQLWSWDLDDPAWDAYSDVLSKDEREHAQGYKTSVLKMNYQRCRTALRLTLSRYVAIPAAQIVFSYNRYGKPMLAQQQCYFNVSHSGSRAICAVSASEVGVDLESHKRIDIDIDALIPLICHTQEMAHINTLNVHKNMQFFWLWTCKEAYCKAQGDGLQRDLTGIKIEDRFGAKVVDEQSCNSGDWYLYPLEIFAGFAACVCSMQHNCEIEIMPPVSFS